MNTSYPGRPDYEGQKSGLCFMIHHDRLVEFTYNIDERIEYVKKHKPSYEVNSRLYHLAMIPYRGRFVCDNGKSFVLYNMCYLFDNMNEVFHSPGDLNTKKNLEDGLIRLNFLLNRAIIIDNSLYDGLIFLLEKMIPSHNWDYNARMLSLPLPLFSDLKTNTQPSRV